MRLPATTLCIPVLVLCLSLTGCFEPVPRSQPAQGLRVPFRMPDGWSELSEQEWRDMDLGTNYTQVTVMDAERLAGFSIVSFSMAGMNPATSIDSIHAAGPGKYKDYRLITKGAARFAGRSVGEILYQGQNPGKELRWYRVIISASPGGTGDRFMLIHTAPIGRERDFAEAFSSIEKSWQWQG